MRFEEKIHWIADGLDKRDEYEQTVQFVRNFGLKCDSVGWTKTTIDCDEKLQLLREIRDAADNCKARLRCVYEKQILAAEIDWYFLSPCWELKDDDYDRKRIDLEEAFYTEIVKGYRVPSSVHCFSIGRNVGVSQDFVDVCEQNGLTGSSFIWIEDSGKYASRPFFSVVPEYFVQRATTGGKLLEGTHIRMEMLRQTDAEGGNLEFLKGIFDELQFVYVPVLIDPEHMPDADFAYTMNDGMNCMLLVRKSAAEKLIAEGVLTPKDLNPALYFDEKKHSELIREYECVETIPKAFAEKQRQAYEVYLTKTKPVFQPKEKDALKLLKEAKRENKVLFGKAWKKELASGLAVLAPYYAVANGGALSDEIEYFSVEEVKKETDIFLDELHTDEQLASDMPELTDSVVIGKAANGDYILLETGGRVIRLDHEDPYLSQQWENVHSFFYETITL